MLHEDRLPRRSDQAADAALLPAGLEASPDLYLALNPDGVIRSASAASRRVLGYEPADMIGQNACNLVMACDRDLIRESLTLVAGGEPVSGLESRWCRNDGSTAWLEWNAALSPQQKSISAVARDLSERKQTEALLSGQNRLLQMIGAGESLPRILDALARFLEAQSGEGICSILLMDPRRQVLRLAAAPSLPAEVQAALASGVRVGPAMGSCGTAAHFHRPIEVEDIAGDPLWAEFRHLVLPHGLKACWSTPICDGGEMVMGTLALYYRGQHRPSSWDRYLVEKCTDLARMAIAHHRTHEQLLMLQSAIQNIDEGIVIAAPAANGGPPEVLWVNDGWCRMNGYSAAEIIGQPTTGLRAGPPDPKFLEEVARAERYGIPFSAEVLHRRKDGGEYVLEFHAMPIFDASGYQTHWVSVDRDITARKEAEKALAEKERLYRLVADNARDLIALHTPAGTFRYVSPSCVSMLGYSPEQLAGTNPYRLVHPEDRYGVFETFKSARRSGQDTQASYRIRRKSGEYAWFETLMRAIRDESGRVVQIQTASRDVTERRAIEEQLAHQAFHDPLTNLPNRALFLNRVAHALERVQRRPEQMAVVVFDLDNFKVINDSLGHGVGDTLLVKVAERLSACLRPGDTAARLGGDEFAVLLEEIVNGSEAARLAERIAVELRAPFRLQGQEMFITASSGIVVNTPEHRRPETLLRDADVAMYRAKQLGKATYAMFDPNMKAAAQQRLRLESELRRAVERGELRLHYQPLVCLETGVVTGVEALVRWEHPERGLVPPMEFIPVAEETGLILPIGQWVLLEACRQARAWQHAFPASPSLTVNVNLSARQVQRGHVVEEVALALRETGLDPGLLELELTESMLMQDAERAVAVLTELKGLGVRLAIDDFGTGYSSMSYLKRFPVDVLKVDRSFVQGIEGDQGDSAIVRAVISMAHAMGLKVVGEGVETKAQLQQLRHLRCHHGQGYLFARPLPPDALGELLRTQPHW